MNLLKKYLVVLAILVTTLIFAMSLNIALQTEEPLNNFSYTKAICSDENFCRDYVISCLDEKVLKINPTGAAVQFTKSWQDPRTKEEIEKIC